MHIGHLVAPLLAVAALLGAAAAETRVLSDFDSVRASDRLEVEVVIGPVFSVEVSGADAARVRTRVDGRRLDISDGRRPWFGGGRKLDAQIRVAMPAIEGLAAARGADMTATLSGRCDDFSAAAAMGASLRVDGIECENVDAAAAMGAQLRLSGTCGAMSVAAAMGGEVRAQDLQCESIDASAAMGGEIRAFASQTYAAAASMGGSVDVAGEGARGETAAAMGGSIRERP